jgi:hypothetical protein
MPTCEACPTCHRPYPTPRVERLTANLADALAQIARQTDNGKVYVRVPAYQFGATHARLALWGLAEELLHPRRSGSGQTRSGSWRPTAKGMQWLSGLAVVPSEVFVQGGKVVGLGRAMISFDEALVAAPTSGKGKARKAVQDEGERLFLAEQAQLEASYLEAD